MSRTRTSVQHWRKIIRDRQASGQFVAEYCRRAWLSALSLSFWRRRLRADREAATKFVEVKVARSSPIASAEGPGCDASGVELRLQRGRCVILRPGFDRGTLLDLLQVLEASATPGDTGEADA